MGVYEIETEGGVYQVETDDSPQQANPNDVGANYKNSYLGVAGEALAEAPRGFGGFLADAWDFAMPIDALTVSGRGGMYDTIANSSPETVAQVTGKIGAGAAGAGALAPWGASAGAAVSGPFAPLGALVGGGIGAGVGGALGMFGFDVGADALSDAAGEVTGRKYVADPNDPSIGIEQSYLRPSDEYIKDLIYNSVQGTATAGAIESVRGLPQLEGYRQSLTRKGAEAAATAKAAAKLQELKPGITPDEIDAAMVPGTDPLAGYRSLGEVLGSDDLLNAQRSLANSGEAIIAESDGRLASTPFGRAREADRLRNDAKLRMIDQLEPAAGAPTMGEVQNTIRDGFEQPIAQLEAQRLAAEQAVQDGTANLPQQIEAQDAGVSIRENLREASQGNWGKMSSEFERAGDGVVAPPTEAAQIAAFEIQKRFPDGSGASPQLLDLVKRLNREGEPGSASGLVMSSGEPIPPKPAIYTVREIQKLRSDAIAIAKAEGGSSSGSVASKIADALLKSEDDAIAAGTMLPEQKTALTTGRALRRQFDEDFQSKANPNQAILNREYGGQYAMPDSTVPSRVFRTGNKGVKEGLQAYKRVVGAANEALEPIYRYAVDSFRKAVKEDGTLDTRLARKWLADHADALNELPELKAQLTNLDGAQKFLNEKFGDLTRAEQDYQKSALQIVLKTDPEQVVAKMLSNSGNRIQQVSKVVNYVRQNHPAALAGLRRGVLDYFKRESFIAGTMTAEEALASGQTFTGQTRPSILASRIADARPALERSGLFSKAQMIGLEDLYKDSRSQMSVAAAKAPGSPTVQNATTLGALLDITKGSFLRKFVGGRLTTIIEPLLAKIPKEKYIAKLEEALLNPKFARDLLNKASEKNVASAAGKFFKEYLSPALGVAATTVPSGMAASQEQKPPPKPPPAPKQQPVTAKESFPDPNKLLAPPTPGKLNLNYYSAETRRQIGVESGTNPTAVSPKGARGYMQLMPATAAEEARAMGEEYYPRAPGMTPLQLEISDDQNIRIGEQYMDKMMNKYKGNRTLAYAAYNAGPGRVDEVISKYGNNPRTVLRQLPAETRNYVHKLVTKYGYE